ncbi:hypothetical protein [Tritonibacter mobilis]|uniref:hypothetical protein n=1 Tax=Tritonibacter mobilis TaxID=379347 RepID=UPI0013A550E4|nr:hypothetical protein [Tritonibacter mobilis]
MTQLSFLDTLDPPPQPKVWTPPPRRKVMTRAYGEDYELELYEEDPDPFEIEVRGIRCLISHSLGFCTYTLDGPGSLFWSDTGFRSFGNTTTDPDQICSLVEAYIDAPQKHGNGLGGKLVRWWPMYVRQWYSNRRFELSQGRKNTWDQWGPERHAECWNNHDTKQLAALERMKAEGIDPDDVLSSIKQKQPPVSMMEWQTGRAA